MKPQPIWAIYPAKEPRVETRGLHNQTTQLKQ